MNRAQVDPEQLYTGGMAATVQRMLDFPSLVYTIREPQAHTAAGRVLAALREHGQMCCGDAASRAGITAGHASVALSTLRGLNLVVMVERPAKPEWRAL